MTTTDENAPADTAQDATTESATTETAGEPANRPAAERRKMLFAFAFGVLPAVAIALAGFAGYLRWEIAAPLRTSNAAVDSVRAASDATVALLSYRSDTVDQDLNAARDRLTGEFRDSYASLTKDVVIPGSKEEGISAMASVPAAASLSASSSSAEVLLFVNQTTTIGDAAPTDSTSTVRVTMDLVDGRWLMSEFEPI